ncbi:MAG: hypothetical protein M9918_15930 [Anaerolineae bacterium]|nr:hypothetical protein [Anaerolineae bacterium]MCO5192370.1 hypothetical protein [Anaerolineae bacterium]
MRPLRKRPISVTIVIVGVLFIGAINLWRVAGLLRQMNMLLTLPLTMDPRLQLAIASGWAILSGVLGWMVWRFRPITRWLVPVALALYTIARLLQTVFFAHDMPINSAELILSAAIIAFSWWALNRPAATSWFQSHPTTGTNPHGQTRTTP